MSVDVMRNPSSVDVVVTWYRPSETTPFAVAGHLGPVLAMLNESRYGPGAKEIWFDAGSYETSEGDPIADEDIYWWALMPASPDAKQEEDDDIDPDPYEDPQAIFGDPRC